jgi:hypothetical protein
MSVNVPESVFDKYYDVIDSTFDIFGVTCKLVTVSYVEEIVYNPNNNIPEINSVNAHRIKKSDYERANKIIKEVDTYTDIKLKVYWNPKEWVNAPGDIKDPTNVIQTIGFMKDLPLVLKAKSIIVHKEIEDYKKMTFERMGEHIPIGLRQNRYFSCMWSRL